MKTLEEQFKITSNQKKEFAKYYLEYLSTLISTIDIDVIAQIIDIFNEAGKRGNTIYFIGNGGSAATASHFASDLSMNTKAEGYKLIKAISLVDNLSTITAVANDEGFDNIFVSQLEVILEKNDVVVALSVSGNSPNIVKAIEYSNLHGAITIGCTGFDGGKLREISQTSLHIDTENGEYGPVEDIFQILDHLIYTYLRLDRFGRLAH